MAASKTAPPFIYGSSFLPLPLPNPASSKLSAPPTINPEWPCPYRNGHAPAVAPPPMVYSHTDPGCILLSPKWPGSGEWGRGSVGEVLVRMRLFRLLVRQLPEKESGCQQRPQTFECEPMPPLFHFRSSLPSSSKYVPHPG